MYKLRARKPLWMSARENVTLTQHLKKKKKKNSRLVCECVEWLPCKTSVRRESSPRVIPSFIFIWIRCISYSSPFYPPLILFYRLCIQGASVRNHIGINVHFIGFVHVATESIMGHLSCPFFL